MYEPGSLELGEMLDLLAGIADDLSSALADLDASMLERTVPGHSRSIAALCRSICEEAEQAHAYLRHVTGDPTPTAASASAEAPTVAASLEALRSIRAQTVALLSKLDPTAWQRSAPYPDWGHLTIEEAALRLLSDEEAALNEIAAIKRGLRG
jgi:hypothetical protein